MVVEYIFMYPSLMLHRVVSTDLIYNYQKSIEGIERGGRGSEGGEFFIILSWPFTLLLAVIVGMIVRGAISLVTWLWRKIARNAEPDSAL